MIGCLLCVLAQAAVVPNAPPRGAVEPLAQPLAQPQPRPPLSVPALRGGLGRVRGLAVDGRGALYVSSEDLGLVFRLEPTGSLTLVAGRSFLRPRERDVEDAAPAAPAPVPALGTRLRGPAGLAFDREGRLLVAERLGRRVLRLDLSTGLVETVAGGDGKLAQPVALAVDVLGRIFVADAGDHRVLSVDAATGTISAVAGDGFPGFFGDGGPATSARLSSPDGLAVAGGALFVADRGNHRVRRIDLRSGRIGTWAGSGKQGEGGDSGPAAAAQLRDPTAVAVAADGALLIADRGNHRLRRVRDGRIATLAGGTARDSALSLPSAVVVDKDGSVYVADTGQRRVHRIDDSGALTTVAGDGGIGYCGDGLSGTAARVAWAAGVAVDPAGNVFYADLELHRVRRVDASSGIVTTVAGDGRAGYDGDGGPATSAALNAPHGVALDAAGQLYFADSDNHRIRRVRRDGVIETVAGAGTRGFSGDGGPATRARLDDPHGIAFDPSGRLLIADYRNQRVRRVDLVASTIETIAGNGGPVTDEDGVKATAAGLDRVSALAVDRDGSVYLSEIRKPRVRRLDPQTGLLHTVAGSGVRGLVSLSGAARSLAFEQPGALALDGDGALLVADVSCIWRIDLASGRMEAWAGRAAGGDKSGASVLRRVRNAHGLAFTPGGALLLTEDTAVRRIEPGAPAIVVVAGGGQGF
jgi:sugar lactone lactonase YvrE